MAFDILVIDDETDIRDLISGILEDEGYDTRQAGDSDSALNVIEERRPSLVVLDIWLQGSRLDGLELLNVIKKDHPDLPVIIISGHGNIETAVSAIRQGAYDYIEKPFKADRLILVVARALEASMLKRENVDLRARTGSESDLIGSSTEIKLLRQSLQKVAPTNSRVLISGPSGVGKELAARTLHSLSARASGPFIVLNAATMAPERMEIELFGTEDEEGIQIGAFEEAHGGTLFIDQVADMPLETQSKILRVLVDQQFHRVGGNTKVKVDVRIVSSSSRDLAHEIARQRFREDLFHRLNVVPIRVPTLAERREDIPELIDYFMTRFSRMSGLQMRSIGDDALAALQAHEWPGNVRQLRNNVERLMILASDDDGPISAQMLPSEVGDSVSVLVQGTGGQLLMALPLREAREVFEREYLVSQIGRFGGNISRTAAFIGMERSALHRKLKLLNVNLNQRSRSSEQVS